MQNSNAVLLDRAKSAVLARDYTTASRIYTGMLKDDPENVGLL